MPLYWEGSLPRSPPRSQVQAATFRCLLGQHSWQRRAWQGPAEQRGPRAGITFPPYSQSAATGRTQVASGQLYLGILCCCGLVWFGFSPCPYSAFQCMCHELSSNISAPPRQWSCCRCGYVGGRLSVGKSAANVWFRPHAASHLCLSKKPEALSSMLQVRVLPCDLRAGSSVGTSQGSCTEGSPDEQIFS